MNDVYNDEKIPVGISQCLLGDKVRYDGAHKRSAICMEQLVDYFEFHSTCPEMAIGMGVPRPTIHLVEHNNDIQLLEVKDHSKDHTQAMQSYAKQRVTELSHLCGYIVAKNSPSCGMERVKVYRDNGYMLAAKGIGLFTQVLMQHYPNLPVEEDGRLHDSLLRDNFLFRVFVYWRWQKLLQSGLSLNKLYNFHAQVKYALMAHHYESYKTLGKLLANLDNTDREALVPIADQYFTQLMSALKHVVQRKHHKNTLMHIMGYFKKDISAVEKQVLLDRINDFSLGKVPLGVPIAILQLYLNKFPKPYLEKQLYLFPYPQELSERYFI